MLPDIDAPPGSAVLLEGSIAEGFGNSSSDVDFLFVAPGSGDLPTMPSVLFADGRRVEVRTRSARQVADQFAVVTAAAARGTARVVRLPEDLLNRCQRLLHGFVLEDPGALPELPSKREFAAIMTAWWAHRARQAMRYALALSEVDAVEDAAVWAHAALVQGAKSWVAALGETYLEPKWLSLQVDRAGASEPATRYRELESGAGLPARAYVAACGRLLADFGIGGCVPKPGRITLARVPGVTTWPVGDRVHVVRDRRDVFVLGDEVARTWRSVVFGRAPGRDAAIARFVRLGLVRFSWGRAPITPSMPLAAASGPVAPPPSPARPVCGFPVPRCPMWTPSTWSRCPRPGSARRRWRWSGPTSWWRTRART
ncbi:hypothetical protein GCM10009754_29520 [Amycolatopsis minnesotensis]|uniref:Polymerase nucleotidyl transferase domain-containing protein n=1 Tax=Amycolatopsis minnesotensis TaxID=337894 RepID=A0ABP5C795_9PSEU